MDINTEFGYWVRVAPFAGYKLEKYSRPAYVGDKPVPQNLNELTLGQLIELSELEDSNESLYKVCSVILGMSHEETDKARAVDVVGFIGWVLGEVEKINKLFESTNTKPTEEERKAGIEQLKFGLFGMLDWYAQRMRIQDHEEVAKTPWMRVYKCLDMDAKKLLFNRKLQEIQADEYRRKIKGNRHG
jgi:hypothetical protein